MTEAERTPPVVADSTPLIALAGVGLLEIVRDLYGRLAIPPAVWDEVVVAGAGRAGADEVRSARWIDVVPLDAGADLSTLLEELDRGEAEALCLAEQVRARAFIVDERRARRVAEARKVPILGTLGVLADGTRRGMLTDLPGVFLRLESNGFRMSPAERTRALALAAKPDNG